MPKDLDDFDEDELENIINSKMVQKYLAYRKLTDGINSIQEDDVMYQQLVNGVQDRVGQNLAERTVREVLDSLVTEVESNTEALEQVEDDEDDYL